MLIFEPLTIRGMTLKNRVVMSPMDVGVGFRSRRAIAYYAERARGGTGAIICGLMMSVSLISDEAWGKAGGAAAFADGLRQLADEVHRAGARIGIQISHPFSLPGGVSMFNNAGGRMIAPSPRTEPDPPRHVALDAGTELQELTAAEIEEITGKYARAAAVVREIGFDFVEMHGANGHFAGTFFSPIDNRRSDKYGGDLKKRMRFGLETTAAMREAVGDDFPVFYRLGAEENDMPGGFTTEDAAAFAVELVKAGADVMDISVGSFIGVHPLPDDPMGTYADLAAAIKQKVKVPVAAVGRINTPEVAESILSQGKADLVYIGRQLIADPHWVNKVAEGRAGDIVPCIGCMHCHHVMFYKHQPAECAVNPAACREHEFRILPAEQPKKVLVVGGGPAGMEAAIIASQRGHRVTLMERLDRLGGQLASAGVPPHKEEINRLNRYLAKQVGQAGIAVKLRTEATAESVAGAGPDAVIVAAGAEPAIPDIPGARGKNVLTALDVLGGRPTGKNVIVVGGGLVGCETALFLAAEGKNVKILEMLDGLGADAGDETVRARLVRNLQNSGVESVTGAEAREITDRAVKATLNGATMTFEADTVVLAAGMRSSQGLTRNLSGKATALYSIGDCVEPGKIANAIHDGARVACEL